MFTGEKMEYRLIKQNELNEEMINKLFEAESNSGGNPYDKDCFAEILSHKTNLTFACIDKKDIVGILTINTKSKKFGGSAYIINISVRQEFHRQGLATKLILEAVKYFKKNNFKKPISLEVDKTNLPAYNLYLKLGFQLVDDFQDVEHFGLLTTLDNITSKNKI